MKKMIWILWPSFIAGAAGTVLVWALAATSSWLTYFLQARGGRDIDGAL